VFVTDDDRAKIKRIAHAMFLQQRELGEVPRMAAGVVAGGQLVSFVGYDATESSLFRIASMTKSFTAAATLILRDEGRVQLDAPVATYAPEYASLTGPTADAPPITLRHLLNMSSGLATDDPWGDRHLDISDADLDAIVQANPVFGEHPGTAFEYSNLGYAIIGRVIQRVTGRRPQDFITERLIQPLGMTHTVWESAHAPAGSDIVIGTRADGLTPESIPLDGGLATMGGLWSTVADLTRWIGFFTDAYPVRNDTDTSSLKRSSRREMQSIHTFVEPRTYSSLDGTAIENTGGYGMGLVILHDATLGQIAGHSGGLPGYGSNMRWVKGSGYGVVALGNKTYAPMATATRRTLDALSAAKVVRKPKRDATAALADAGTRLFSLLTDWSDAAAERLFADNVGPDGPFAERRTHAGEFTAKHAPLRLARIEPTSEAAGRIVAQSDRRELAIEFSLAPLPGTLIQEYELPKD
jgi:CubicO group peptidase (beta-lactamase class C family)